MPPIGFYPPIITIDDGYNAEGYDSDSSSTSIGSDSIIDSDNWALQFAFNGAYYAIEGDRELGELLEDGRRAIREMKEASYLQCFNEDECGILANIEEIQMDSLEWFAKVYRDVLSPALQRQLAFIEMQNPEDSEDILQQFYGTELGSAFERWAGDLYQPIDLIIGEAKIPLSAEEALVQGREFVSVDQYIDSLD
jgi:hypothetical protein